MQCSKCSASRMTMRSEKPIGTVYMVRVFHCSRCDSTTKQVIPTATQSPLLVLASAMLTSPVAIR